MQGEAERPLRCPRPLNSHQRRKQQEDGNRSVEDQRRVADLSREDVRGRRI